MKKLLFLITLISFTATAQIKNDWNIGVGFSVVNFGDEGAKFIGDKTLFQLPRLNITAPITEEISFDLAYSFQTINNVGVFENNANYYSFDGSVRYNFHEVVADVNPYLFVGASLVKAELKTSPTLNIGAGTTYWFGYNWGVNGQLYYKHSFENFQGMRSHIQLSLGVVYSFYGNKLFGKSRRL